MKFPTILIALLMMSAGMAAVVSADPGDSLGPAVGGAIGHFSTCDPSASAGNASECDPVGQATALNKGLSGEIQNASGPFVQYFEDLFSFINDANAFCAESPEHEYCFLRSTAFGAQDSVNETRDGLINAAEENATMLQGMAQRELANMTAFVQDADVFCALQPEHYLCFIYATALSTVGLVDAKVTEALTTIWTTTDMVNASVEENVTNAMVLVEDLRMQAIAGVYATWGQANQTRDGTIATAYTTWGQANQTRDDLIVEINTRFDEARSELWTQTDFVNATVDAVVAAALQNATNAVEAAQQLVVDAQAAAMENATNAVALAIQTIQDARDAANQTAADGHDRANQTASDGEAKADEALTNAQVAVDEMRASLQASLEENLTLLQSTLWSTTDMVNDTVETTVETTMAESIKLQTFITDPEDVCIDDPEYMPCVLRQLVVDNNPVTLERVPEGEKITIQVPGSGSVVIIANPETNFLQVYRDEERVYPPSTGTGMVDEDTIGPIPIQYISPDHQDFAYTELRIDVDSTPDRGQACPDGCLDNSINETNTPSWAVIRFDDDYVADDDEDGDGDVDAHDVHYRTTGPNGRLLSDQGGSNALHIAPFCPALLGCGFEKDVLSPFDLDGRETLTISEIHIKTAPENDYGRYYLYSDLDDDGISDLDEINCGSNWLHQESTCFDHDGDELDYTSELAWGADPYDKDTDNDGLEDGVEDIDGDGVLDPVPAHWTNYTVGDLEPQYPGTRLENGLDRYNLIVADGLETSPVTKDTDGDGSNDWDAKTGNRDPQPRDAFIQHFDRDGDDLLDNCERPDGTQFGPIVYTALGQYAMTTDHDVDTDGDGLNNTVDGWDALASCFMKDTDSDGLEDDEELYGHLVDAPGLNTLPSGLDTYPAGASTKAYSADTDGDHLTDLQELFAEWDGDITRLGVTPAAFAPDWAQINARMMPDVRAVYLAHPATFEEGGLVKLDLSDTFTTPTLPNNRDTDGDGLRDYEELAGIWEWWKVHNDVDSKSTFTLDQRTSMPTDPAVRDTDGDGWTDGQEAKDRTAYSGDDGPTNCHPTAHGNSGAIHACDGGLVHTYRTSPFLIDSDGDGIIDFQELDNEYHGYTYTYTCGSSTCTQSFLSDPAKYDTDGDGLSDGQETKDTDLGNRSVGQPLDPVNNPARLDCGTGKEPKDVTAADCNGGFGTRMHVSGPQLGRPTPEGGNRGGSDTDRDGLDDLTEIIGNFTAISANAQSYGLDRAIPYIVPDPATFVPYLDPNNDDVDGDHLHDGHELDPSMLPAGATTIYNATNPFATDTDEDGLPDNEEIARLDGNDCPSVAPFNGIVFTLNFGPINGVTACDGGWGTDPLDPDADGDGMYDGEEVALRDSEADFPLSPTNPDSDGDHLIDGREGIDTQARHCERTDTDGNATNDCDGGYHTNPELPDTDDDGLLDGDEVDIYNTSAVTAFTDGDIWDDGEEVSGASNPVYGTPTDPTLTDTDGDGLSDDQETWDTVDPAGCIPELPAKAGGCDGGYGTDPTRNDTDADGYLDGIEIAAGTNPLDISDVPDGDNDDDGLLDVWEDRYFGNGDGNATAEEIHKYGPDDDPDGDDFTNLEEHAAQDADPATPDSDPTDATSVPDDRDGDGLPRDWEILYFTGEQFQNETSDEDEGVGDNLTNALEFEHGTDPTSIDTDADGLDDGSEVERNTDPLDPDTDGDGLQDGEEVYSYTTDPRNADSDTDGLTDGEEVHTYGTEPTNADTDGDKFTDGAEVLAGNDPNNADDNPGEDGIANVRVPDPVQVLTNRQCDFTTPTTWDLDTVAPGDSNLWNSEECGDADFTGVSAEALRLAAETLADVEAIAGGAAGADAFEAGYAAIQAANDRMYDAVQAGTPFLDSNDARDLDADGTTAQQPNGQMDFVERNIIYVNIDEPGDNPSERFDGDGTGFTIVLVDPVTDGSVVGSYSNNRIMTVRVGDVASTERAEAFVIEILGSDTGRGEEAICVYQDGGVYEDVGFHEGTACSNVLVPSSQEALDLVMGLTNDADGDLIPLALDNCADNANFDQTDADQDGQGDACDNDRDGDGVPNGEDEFPDDAAESSDADGDGVGDGADTCPGSDDTLDADGDGVPDGCDTQDNGDDDGDGVQNWEDICPGGDDRIDADQDGVPDDCDEQDGNVAAAMAAVATVEENATEVIDLVSDAAGGAPGVVLENVTSVAEDATTLADGAVAMLNETLAGVDGNGDGMPDALEPSFDQDCFAYDGSPVYPCTYEGHYYVFVFGTVVDL